MDTRFAILAMLAEQPRQRTEILKALPIDKHPPLEAREALRQLLDWGMIRERLQEGDLTLTQAGAAYLEAMRSAEEMREENARKEAQRIEDAVRREAEQVELTRNQVKIAVISAAVSGAVAFAVEHMGDIAAFIRAVFHR